MAGDYTRFTFGPQRDYSGVFKQQGRVDLDADFNELIEIVDRRWRSETIDIIGHCIVPNTTPDAFKVTLTTMGDFNIGIGRMYVDGIQVENHGGSPLDHYQADLGELRGNTPIPYSNQPYLPAGLPPKLVATTGTTDLVYIDVWQREVTVLEDPSLREIALGGPDTTTRIQSVWQVRALQIAGRPGCGDVIREWSQLVAPSAGRLTTSAVAPPSADDPCIISPSGGYRGLENRLYRVEIHSVGPIGGDPPAKFKWSRNNATIASSVSAILPSSTEIIVQQIGRDQVLRFRIGDWIEITDDFREFQGLVGHMAQITNIDEANRVLTFAPAIPGTINFNADDATRHTRVRRWDQTENVDNNGLLDVVAGPIDIEDGIRVTFNLDPTGVSFKIGDYWLFSARTADGSIDILQNAPPRGILHHFCRLGFIHWGAGLPGTTFTDCRVIWPPASGECCDCTVCVSAESHNSGTLTLNTAISQVQGKGGGKVCLGPGIYNITETVKVGGPNAIEISGHGLPRLVAGTGLPIQNPIMEIAGSVDVSVGDIGFVGPSVTQHQLSIPGLVVVNSMFVRINRCLFSGSQKGAGAGTGSLQDTLSPAIGIAGFVWDAAIRDNFFNTVKVGIGLAPGFSPKNQPFLLAYSSIQNNKMACTNAGVMFSDPEHDSASFLEVSFADNSVASPIGFQMSGIALDIAIERNSFVVSSNSTFAPSAVNAAIVCSANQARISNNQISADRKNPGRDGIVLDGTTIYGTHVVGNHINGLSGTGILIKGRTSLLKTIIAQNQLLKLSGTGILIEQGSVVREMNITGNSLASVALDTNQLSLFSSPLGGIVLLAPSSNINVSENVIEVVGPKTNASRAGIHVNVGADVRIAGNRIVDIGPQGVIDFSAGIFAGIIVGRVDIVDNEVRRASIPPTNSSDTSRWITLLIGVVVGDVNVRGNLLESFGSIPTVAVLFARSCIFSNNQCFLDNSASAQLQNLVVLLGVSTKLTAGAIIASGNFVQGPMPPNPDPLSPPVMNLNPADVSRSLTVLGNITSGRIEVDGSPLALVPWGPLNVINSL